MYSVNIKSGTNGWYDEDGCDIGIARINSPNIPKVGDILKLSEDGDRYEYLVTNVERIVNDYLITDGSSEYDDNSYPVPTEHVIVYVLNISFYRMQEYKKKYEILLTLTQDLIESEHITSKIYREFYNDARDKIYGY